MDTPQAPLPNKVLAASIAEASAVVFGTSVLAQSNNAAVGIEEVVVTARKRADNLQDVPLSIQAFTSEQIENLGIERFEDFAVLSPSISYISWLPGTQMMFIRGIADGSNPNRTHTATATMYLDEQPLTYSGGIADLHSYDIERIEVLNGPQGTYYGASATSGTVRIITNKPDPDAFSAGGDFSFGTIDEGEDTTTIEGYVNIPLVEGVSALRLVGWYDESNGFVDNVQRTRTYSNGASATNTLFVEDDYNEETTKGMRAALGTDMGDRWKATLSAFYQDSETVGAWDHDPSRVGELEVARFGPEEFDITYGQIALTLEGDMGIADIVYAGAYYVSTNGGSPLPDEWWSTFWESGSEQIALFGEVSYDLSDRLSATAGIRAFDSEFEGTTDWGGYFYDAKTASSGGGGTDDVIYKFSLNYQMRDDLLTYFTYAEGFRPGGGNSEGATNPNVPEIYEPDVLDSYEVGWKSTLLEGRATFNGAVYYMEWTDFQTSIYDLLISPLVFRANAGNAEVTGFEAEFNAALSANFSMQVAATYNDSVLAEDFNSTVDPSVVWAAQGRELPYVPKWKYSVNTRYEWTQSASVTGYAQATYAYTGSSWNLLITEPFQAEAVPERQSDYDLLDLRIGWDIAGGRYGAEVFASNLFDERAEIFINTGNYDERITTNRPRTLGLRLKMRLE